MQSSYRKKVRREAMRAFHGDFGIELNVNVVSDVTGSVESAVNKVKSVLPGPVNDLIDKAKGTLDDVALNRLKSFAESDTGKMLLRAGATGLFYTLAITGAPFFLVSAVFAIPGLFRGEPFDQAWITEFMWRVETTQKILGKDIQHQWSEELGRVVNGLKANPSLQTLPIDQIAAKLNAREDIVSYAIALLRRSLEWLDGAIFDPVTGKRKTKLDIASESIYKASPRPAFVTKYLQALRASNMTTTKTMLLGRSNISSRLGALGTGQGSNVTQPMPPTGGIDNAEVKGGSALPIVLGAGLGAGAAVAAGLAFPLVGAGLLVGAIAGALFRRN